MNKILIKLKVGCLAADISKQTHDLLLASLKFCLEEYLIHKRINTTKSTVSKYFRFKYGFSPIQDSTYELNRDSKPYTIDD